MAGPSIASAQQLNLSWVDNSGGQAGFIIQRAADTTGTYTQIAQVPPGVLSYTDTGVSLGTTYCYRVAAFNGAGMSAFSEPTCGNPSGGFTLTVVKAGGDGTVTSNSGDINCGTVCAYTYLAGKVVTLTATPSAGSTFTGWSGGGCSGTGTCTLVGNVPTTVTATFAAGAVDPGTPNPGSPGDKGPATLNLAFNGKLRDRVGQGNTALGADGALDGTLTATLSASGGRTVTSLRLDSDAPGTWDTSSATGFWVLAVASSLDGAVLNAPGSMAVNFPVANGGSFVVFASDYLGTEFVSGRTLTLVATFSDGSTATAVTTVNAPPTLALAYNGLLRDRVGQGETALGSDGVMDGTLTATLSASGGRTVMALRLDGDYAPAPGCWLTNSPGTTHYVLGTASSLDGPFLNAPGTMAVNFAVADGGSFVLFAADWHDTGFQPGRTLTLTATFADGSTATAVTTVP